MWIVLLDNKPDEAPRAGGPFHLRDTDTETKRNRTSRLRAHEVPTLCGLELPAREIMGMSPPSDADACPVCLTKHEGKETTSEEAAPEEAAPEEAAPVVDAPEAAPEVALEATPEASPE